MSVPLTSPVLFIASNNPGKLHEIHSLLAAYPSDWCRQVQLLTPADLGITLEVVEDGQTYIENASTKVRAFATEVSRILPVAIVLADDSGLEVETLGSAPGIHSARYAPHPDDFPSGRPGDADRRAYLLQQLLGHPKPWLACFRCIIAIADAHSPSVEIQYAEGLCRGEIIHQERGNNGFGYDPIFYIPEMERTMAELTTAEKNRLSHRARAVMVALPIVEKMLKGHE